MIAEILLQRTRAGNVVNVYHNFISRFDTIEKFHNASKKEIIEIINPLGLTWRAENLIKLAVYLKKHHGIIPRNIKKLKDVPGVGCYVSSSWLSFHNNQRANLIDANIVRFICRLNNMQFDGETRRKKWLNELIDQLTPLKGFKEFNYSILDFSMLICRKIPKCQECPIINFCLFDRKR